MSLLLTCSLVALWASTRARWRESTRSRLDLGAWAVVTVLTWIAAGGLAMLLASMGAFSGFNQAIAQLGLAALIWPYRGPSRVLKRKGSEPNERSVQGQDRPSRASRLAIAAAIACGVWLRWPPGDHPLGGRDQGTYTLVAQQILRTGALQTTDALLAEASREAPHRSGPGDLLGLYPISDDPARSGLYEGSYRPGFYLASRSEGRITPQFLHLHASLLAVAGALVGPANVHLAVGFEGALWLVLFACTARTLWPRGPFAAWAAWGFATQPLLVWTARTPVSEALAGCLMMACLLALARARTQPSDAKAWILAAALSFGSLAFVRGHVFVSAPLGLLMLLCAQADAERPGARLFAGLVAASAVFHAHTSFPYLYDEFARQLHLGAALSPESITLAAIGGVGLWGLTHRVLLRFDLWTPRITRVATRGVLLLFSAAVVLHLVSRALATAEAPYSRLDPAPALMGFGLLALGGFGLFWTAVRGPSARPFELACAAHLALTTLLYAQRNLPAAGLFYYGRYLAPEFVPAALLFATRAAHLIGTTLHDRMLRWTDDASSRPARALRARSSPGAWGGALLFAALLERGATFATTPTSRLREFEGASEAVSWLASQLPPSAVVLAGGEGWHHGHTFNQIGGALAMGHGVQVLPYKTREAAYASLHELLIARPRVHGVAAPPVYLLLNEATREVRRQDPAGPAWVPVDDVLWAPFVAEGVGTFELIVDRLTPSLEAIPHRVTRDSLRMALLRIHVDDDAARRVRSFGFDTAPDPSLTVKGGTWNGPHLCLEASRPLRLRFHEPIKTPVELVVVLTPGTATQNAAIDLRAGKRRLPTAPAFGGRSEGDTLGPFGLASGVKELKLRGFPEPVAGAVCPHGGLFELRLLPVPSSGEPPHPAPARTFAWSKRFHPNDDLGHAVEDVVWTRGRGLSAYRAGLSPTPELSGRSLVLRPGTTLRFAPERLPDDGASPLFVVATLPSVSLERAATLTVRDRDTVIARWEIPPRAIRPGPRDTPVWQTPAVSWQPTGPFARLSLALEAAPDTGEDTGTERGEPGDAHDESGGSIELRDLGLFVAPPQR